MAKPNTGKAKGIWLLVLILFVCVAATATAFLSRMDGFFQDDEGAISLITESSSGTDHRTDRVEGTKSGAESTAASAPTAGQKPTAAAGASATAPQATQLARIPGFEAGGDSTVWSTNTQVELFRVSYVNGEQVITVSGDNGDKVIAPGTESSYTFKLKNTGEVALDYTVEIDAYFTPDDVEIPITGRLSRYDGVWIVGGRDEYATVSALDTAADKATLGAGKYTYYTLDWRWPFEGGNDEADTALGDLAANRELTFTVVINTTATASGDPYDDSGITPPQTGDNTSLTRLVVPVVGSFAVMMLVLLCRNGEKRRCRAEEDRS